MKKVLVLGAGYGSLSCLCNLSQEALAAAKITLVSNYPYHYTSILLHEVASGVRKDSAQFMLSDILPRAVEVVQDTVKEIKGDVVVGTNGNYEYDILVVGLGFSSDNFGIPESRNLPRRL